MVRESGIAANHTSGTRNSRGLTGNVGHSRAASLFPEHRILSPPSKHSPCLAETRADSLWRVHLSFSHKVHLSSFVELFSSLPSNFSVILQFRNNLWSDFLYKIYSSPQIFFGFPFKLRKPVGLHAKAPFPVIQVEYWFHQKRHIRISPLPTFPVHFHFSFRESYLSDAFTLKSSPGFSFKVIMKVLSFRHKSFLFRGRYTSTISLPFQQRFLYA